MTFTPKQQIEPGSLVRNLNPIHTTEGDFSADHCFRVCRIWNDGPCGQGPRVVELMDQDGNKAITSITNLYL